MTTPVQRGDQSHYRGPVADRKGIGEVVSILPDLASPRLSFLFAEDDTDFIPPFPRLKATSTSGQDHTWLDYTALEQYLGMPHVDQWLAEYLQWLGSWSALVLAQQWSVDKKRRTIAQIFPLYRMRGTRIGLEKLLTLFLFANDADEPSSSALARHTEGEAAKKKDTVVVTDNSQNPPTPAMQVDQFQLRDRPGPDDPVLNGYQPYGFTVKVTLHTNDAHVVQHQIDVLRQVLDQEKPAHATYTLLLETPTLALDQKDEIGVNTYLGNAHLNQSTS